MTYLASTYLQNLNMAVSDIFKYLPVSSAFLEARRYLFINVDLGDCPLDSIVHGLLKQSTQNILILYFFTRANQRELMNVEI